MASHPHYENMLRYAQDAQETDRPWVRWQYRNVEGEWVDFTDSNPIWSSVIEYRRKPQTIKRARLEGDIQGVALVHTDEIVKIPEPEEHLLSGEYYYVADPCNEDFFRIYQWTEDNIDKRIIKRRLVHKTKEAAIRHSKAIIQLAYGSTEE